jgi:putative acyl-CoA dehydrogenase
MATHEVLNQPPPLENYDPYESDPVLRQAVEREGGGWGHRIIADFGRRVVSSEVIGWGFDANVNVPRLVTHDRYGHRSDTVEYHPPGMPSWICRSVTGWCRCRSSAGRVKVAGWCAMPCSR